MDIKAVIFDLDGTLIDTERIYSIFWPIAVADMGYEMTHEQYLALRSLGKPYVQALIKEWYGEEFDYQEARRIRKGYFDRYIAEHGLHKKKGAAELLEYLHGKGIVTAVATASSLDRATEYLTLTGLYSYFDKIVSAHMVERGKPSPDVYLYACEQLGFAPCDCMAVEDAPNGIRSAHAAGCKVIMVPDQSQPDEELSKLFIACVEDLSQIIPLLDH